MKRGFRIALAAVLAVLLWTAPHATRAGEAAPPAATAAEAEALIQTLEDPAARARLIEQLRVLSQAQRSVEPPAEEIPVRIAQSMLEEMSDRVAEAGEAVARAAAFASDARRLYQWVHDEFGDQRTRDRLLEIVLKLAAVFAAGWLVEFALFRLLAPWRARLEAHPGGDEWTRFIYAIAYALAVAAPIAGFAAAAFGALSLAEPSRPARLMALALINANLIVRAASLVSTLLAAPRAPGLRLLPVRDETAAYAQIWARRLAGAAAYGYFIAEAALLLGVPTPSHLFLLKLVGVLVALLVIVLVLQNRANVAAAIEKGESAGGLRHLAAAYWHVPAIVVVILALAFWFVQPEQGFVFIVRAVAVTVLAVAVAIVARRLALQGLARAFSVNDDVRARFPALETRVNRYLQVFNAATVTLIYAFALLTILQAWGMRSFDWLTSPAGQRAAADIGVIVLTLVVALIAWESVNAVMNRYVRSISLVGLTRRQARVRTLVTLVQRVLFILLVAFVALVTMAELGLNIGPLLAGAGVVGLALGLGAQNMIKDLIEGVANILEDSFAVGDAVTIGGKSGVIEEISMRAVRVRDYAGHVHTIPFGEIKIVTNMTRDYAFAVVEVTIDYTENSDRVIDIIKRIAVELREDPALRGALPRDLEVAGVDQFNDTGVRIKARLQVYPATRQGDVQAALNRRLAMAFSHEGVSLNTPTRQVRTLGERPLPPPAPSAAADPG